MQKTIALLLAAVAAIVTWLPANTAIAQGYGYDPYGDIFESVVQSGVATVGRNTSRVAEISVDFPQPFPTTPTVVATPHQNYSRLNIPDAFAVTLLDVSEIGFIARVYRVDSSHGWGQDLQLDWIARYAYQP